MTPIQSIAILVLAILFWKKLLTIGRFLVSIPLLFLGKALIYVGFIRAGVLSASAGIEFALWLDGWMQDGLSEEDE